MTPSLSQLTDRHPQHKELLPRWQLLDAMVAGGHKMNESRKRELLVNPDGRPEGVVSERVKVAAYNNKLGPILSRFISQLLQEEATYMGSSDPFWKEKFFPQGARLDTDDDSRSSFHTFLRVAVLEALTTGKAIAQVDVQVTPPVRDRGEQRKNGGDAPYVLLLPRSALWDWQSDDKGFTFVKLHRYRKTKGRWDASRVPEHDFTIYQREESGKILVSRYIVREKVDPGKSPADELDLDTANDDRVEITPFVLPNGEPLEEKEVFNFKGEYRFPVLTLTMPDSLWMADQLFDAQKSYFNQTAAVEWRMVSSNYAMPVINGVEEDEDDPIRNNRKFGDGYYLTLPTGQNISWLEAPGSAISQSINYRGEVKRDIYDALQQIAMTAADGTAIIARSGLSKKEDRRPEQILLEVYGSLIAEFAKQIADVAAIAHGETVEWKVEGFKDFLGEGLDEDVGDLAGVANSGVFSSSDTLRKACQKRFATRVAEAMDFDKDLLEKVLSEIDNSKPPPDPMALPPAEEEPEPAPEDLPPLGESDEDL